jgi:hypothetical protein
MNSSYYQEFLDLIPNRIIKKLQSLDNIELFSFVKIHKNCCMSNKFRRFWLSFKISFSTVHLSLLYKGHLNKNKGNNKIKCYVIPVDILLVY